MGRLADVVSIGSLAAKVNPAESQLTKKAAGPDMAGVEWPPDKARVDAYQEFAEIWRGAHGGTSLATRHNPVYDYAYISVNIPKVIVTIPADLLFGEDLKLLFDDDAPQELVKRVEDIWQRNTMQTLLQENALDTGYTGDGIWTVGADDGEAVIKTMPAEYWFPEHHPDDVREIERHVLAWKKTYKPKEGKELEFVRMIVHEKGQVLHQLWALEGGKLKREAQDHEWAYFYDKKPDETQPGVKDELLCVHVPNFRTARELFGQSEYVGNEDLFAVINGTMTQVSGVLQRHSDPKMAITPEAFAQATKAGRQDIAGDEMQVVPMSTDGHKPEYITWDGKLDDNMAFLDRTLDLLATVSETAPQLLGRKDWGGDLSGRALKILLLRTLAKVDRKRAYYNTAIPKILELAQRIEGIKEPLIPKLDWPDGLPADVMEKVQEVDARLNQRTMGRKGAVKFLDGVDDDQAQRILDEADEDDQREADVVQGQMQKRERPQINVNLQGLEE